MASTTKFSWRHIIILFAVFALSASLATRTFSGIHLEHPTVKADPADATRQHLAADASVFTSPISSVGVMLPAAPPHAPPSEVRIITAELSDSLYNRPPPSFSIL
jgi:hypothetical protein